MEKRELLIGGGVVAAALLFVFLRNQNAGGSASSTSGGTTDIMGGFQTADTAYVPTSSYNITYNTYKGAVSTSNGNTTYGTPSSPVAAPAPVIPPPAPVPAPPQITTTSPVSVNPVVKPPITNPVAAPAPSAPTAPIHPAAPSVPAPVKTATPTTAPKPSMMGSMHYATPAGGFNTNTSVVDFIKAHGGYADSASIARLANEGGIKGYTGTAAQNQTLLAKLKATYAS